MYLTSAIDEWCALGLSRRHLVTLDQFGPVLAQAGAALRRLQIRAEQAGFELKVASGFRDYARQLGIFNGKACGTRTVTDDAGRVLDCRQFSTEDWLHAVLRYSALPGTSRHHWGTDFDVWDARAVPRHYVLQLTPEEYSASGPFAGLSQWLDERIRKDDAEGFFRPYALDLGGVAPEAWHLSFRPAAREMGAMLCPERLLQVWRCRALDAPCPPEEPLALLDVIEPQLDALLARYVVL